MKAKKPKKVTNVYWSNINTDWRLSSDPIKVNSQYDRLLNWEQPSLAYSFPTSISDWAKFNMNYRSCLQSLEICELASSELLNIIKGEGDQEKVMQRNIEPCGRDNIFKYLAMTQEANGVSDELLIDAYCASRINQYSGSSIESKYNVPKFMLGY